MKYFTALVLSLLSVTFVASSACAQPIHTNQTKRLNNKRPSHAPTRANKKARTMRRNRYQEGRNAQQNHQHDYREKRFTEDELAKLRRQVDEARSFYEE